MYTQNSFILPSDYPMFIRVTGTISFIALILICITLLVIYLNRIKTSSRKKNEVKAETIILKELSERFLIYDTIDEIPKEDLQYAIAELDKPKESSSVFRKALIRTLVHFKLNLSGAIGEIIDSAYVWLKLRRFSLSKLKSSWWYVRAEGLNEMQEMNDTESTPQISRLKNDTNVDVRVFTYAALLTLKADDPFSFLLHEKSYLSEWHQISLLDTVEKIPELKIPEFAAYLHSENNSVVLFCIKAIIHYKQFGAIPKMIEMLDHPDEQIRNQLIWALGLLNAEEAEDKLKEIYPLEHNKNKSQILLALGAIASGSSLGFLKDKFLKADHYQLLKSSVEAIVSHSTELKEATINSLTNLDEEQKVMLKHFQDPRNLYGIH